MNALESELSHDQNIKTVLVENAWAAIKFALPGSAEVFQHEPEIEAIREETVQTYFADPFLRMDVPVVAKYDDVAFTFLLEHEHDPAKFSIHRLSRYVSHLEEQYERDVIPIVYFPNASYNNKSLKRVTRSTFLGKRYHYFTYEAVLLKGMPAEKYLNSDNIFARLMLPFMKYSRQALMEILDSGIKGVLELVEPTKGLRRAKYLDFLLHYFNLNEEEWKTYTAFKQAQNEEQEVNMVGTMLKSQGLLEGKNLGIIEGKNLGIIEGKNLGIIEEGRNILLRLLPKKLGPMPAEIEISIRALTDVDLINSILDRVLEIRNWHEIKQLMN